jgi:hypothetical protein
MKKEKNGNTPKKSKLPKVRQNEKKKGEKEGKRVKLQ